MQWSNGVLCVNVQSIGSRIAYYLKKVYEMSLNGDLRVKIYSVAYQLPWSPSWSRIPNSAKRWKPGSKSECEISVKMGMELHQWLVTNNIPECSRTNCNGPACKF